MVTLLSDCCWHQMLDLMFQRCSRYHLLTWWLLPHFNAFQLTFNVCYISDMWPYLEKGHFKNKQWSWAKVHIFNSTPRKCFDLHGCIDMSPELDTLIWNYSNISHPWGAVSSLCVTLRQSNLYCLCFVLLFNLVFLSAWPFSGLATANHCFPF